MFHWPPVRRLPREIELEVETLLADLRGEAPIAAAEEAVNEASSARGAGLRSLSRFLPRAEVFRPRTRSANGAGQRSAVDSSLR
jgi:hypothetical protein